MDFCELGHSSFRNHMVYIFWESYPLSCLRFPDNTTKACSILLIFHLFFLVPYLIKIQIVGWAGMCRRHHPSSCDLTVELCQFLAAKLPPPKLPHHFLVTAHFFPHFLPPKSLGTAAVLMLFAFMHSV